MSAPGPRTIVCEVHALAPDAITLDALARLQLTLSRLGLELCLRNPSTELQELIAFVGLGDVLRVEAGGQAEQREQSLGVEEERELDDPAS